MKLLAGPISYRLYPEQREWLTKVAQSEGHGSEVVVLRKLLTEAMQKSANRRKRNGKPGGNGHGAANGNGKHA